MNHIFSYLASKAVSKYHQCHRKYIDGIERLLALVFLSISVSLASTSIHWTVHHPVTPPPSAPKIVIDVTWMLLDQELLGTGNQHNPKRIEMS